MTIFDIISMLGGLALFLYGMRIMGDGLKKESSGSFKRALEKVTGSPVLGFLIGAGLTAIIQSATATIVIVSGLVGAGIMSLTQSIGVILGANVGTTITGQIIRLLDVNAEGAQWLNFFKPSTLAPVAAIIGIIFIMAVKSKSSGTVGTIAMGFGILFTGLLNMTSAVEPLSGEPWFTALFTSFSDRPLLGFLAGFAVAFMLQSSSATIGILQALSITGALTFSSVYPIIIGIYLGDCVTTAIVCSIGTKADAKRTGVVNILFNLSEIVLISTAVNVIHACGGLTGMWNQVMTSGTIANTHTVFNLSCALILLPLAKTYGKLAMKIIPDDKDESVRGPELDALDEALFRSPALALNSSYKALSRMLEIVCANTFKALDLYAEYKPEEAAALDADEDYLDTLADNINTYLAKLSPHLNEGLQESIQNYYLLCVNDLERAGDHVHSLRESAEKFSEGGKQFTKEAAHEVTVMRQAVNELLGEASQAFLKQNLDAAKNVEPYVESINELCEDCKGKHIERVARGICSVELGPAYTDIMTHLGRIADMCSNIGVHTIARHNGGAASFEHEYLHNLHHGGDGDYTAKLNEIYDKYSAQFAEIE